MTKRLFLFAGYDRDGIVDETLTYYLTALSKLGDIVFVMDNDTNDAELKKIKQIPNVLYAHAQRHNEYDFGSYKRAYIWARDSKILKKYDWIYLVNDSVLGPLFDIEPILKDLESRGADLTGMISYGDKMATEHIQSWFVGLSNKVANTDWFANFINNIKKEDNKEAIVCKYEFGLSRLIVNHKLKMEALVHNVNETDDILHLIYHQPLQALAKGIPFIKKSIAQNIINNSYVLQYVSTPQDIIRMSRKYLNRLGRSAPSIWQPVFRMRLFGLQILKIYRSKAVFGGLRERKYRIQIFGCLPLIFLHVSK